MNVRPSPVAVALGVGVGALAVLACAAGLLWSGGTAPATVTSARGTEVVLFGQGLYRFDPVFNGAGNRGTDVVTLLVAVPLLCWSLDAYRRRSAVGALLLSGALAWFAYVYASLSLGTAYNELFLVYVAVLSAGVWALALVVRSLLPVVHVDVSRLPRRRLGALLVGAGAVTAFVWLSPLVEAVLAGAPRMLLHRTTMVTDALDLALLTPATVLAGVLVLRRRTEGVLLAVPLLVLLVVLTPAVAAQTAFQLAAGWRFTTAEVVGPIGGFLVLGALAVWALVRVLRAVAAEGAPGDGRAASVPTARRPGGDTARTAAASGA